MNNDINLIASADDLLIQLNRCIASINNSHQSGAELCDDVSIRPDIAEAATVLASILRTIAGIEKVIIPSFIPGETADSLDFNFPHPDEWDKFLPS